MLKKVTVLAAVATLFGVLSFAHAQTCKYECHQVTSFMLGSGSVCFQWMSSGFPDSNAKLLSGTQGLSDFIAEHEDGKEFQLRLATGCVPQCGNGLRAVMPGTATGSGDGHGLEPHKTCYCEFSADRKTACPLVGT